MKRFSTTCFLAMWLLATLVVVPHIIADNDLTVVGNIRQADGLGQIPVGVMELLKDDLKINCVSSSIILEGLSERVKSIVFNRDKSPGTVSILFNPLWHHTNPMFKEVPNSKIKIAYSMFETTKIADQWVAILNQHFDAVVVPDSYLVKVYKDCGVQIPIFELPIIMPLDDYFQKPRRVRPSAPFVFGTTVSCDERKNFPLLIRAFAEEFGNDDNVVLKLNSRFGMVEQCEALIELLGVSNIEFTHDVLTKSQYIEFLDSFDCFVNLSKGEGFSLCPREALALSIPCILTRNTAQITVCKSGLVKVVPSRILEPANDSPLYNTLMGQQDIGYMFNCSKDDAKAALREVYENYAYYQQKAKAGPNWVSQYHWKALKPKYLSLIKPKKIVLDKKNVIANDGLMTDSPSLYRKYKEALNLCD